MENTEVDVLSSIDTEDVFTENDNNNTCLNTNFISSDPKKKFIVVDKKDRITKNKLTKYEYVRIIGERTQQLTKGAKPLIKINKESEDLNYNEIAIEELKNNMIPYKIRRPVNNTYEIWDLEELEKNHLLI